MPGKIDRSTPSTDTPYRAPRISISIPSAVATPRGGGDTPSAQALLAAIVESSDDAIVSKSLDGFITSWNSGAERLFGFSAEEAVGQHITIIIPEDRRHEEDTILASIREGKRIEHYETVRRHKDGSPLDISLTVSPVRDSSGAIVGASKIARNISERKHAAQRQMLLLREMSHRIKNIFAIMSAVIGVSERTATTVKELTSDIRARVNTLAIAYELTLPDIGLTAVQFRETSLFTLVKALFAAHQGADIERASIRGQDVPVCGTTLTSLALLLHEFSTNAVKYGALSAPAGRIEIEVRYDPDFVLTWTEIGGPSVNQPEGPGGFGSQLERATIASLQGAINRDWDPAGLKITLRIPADVLPRTRPPEEA